MIAIFPSVKNKFMSNFYEILEISSDASNEEITKAYKQKAKIYHPDANIGGKESTEALFRLINLAKETLLDPAKRLEHDYAVGIKKRPEPQPKVVYQNAPADNGNNLGKVVGWGLLAFIVGAALGGGFDKK